MNKEYSAEPSVRMAIPKGGRAARRQPGKAPSMVNSADGFMPNKLWSAPMPGDQGNPEELFAAITRLLGGNNAPAPRPVPSNPLLSGPANPIAKRPMMPPPAPIEAPQIPRSGSITDLLRGR